MNDFHAIIFAAIALAIIAVHVALCFVFMELRAIRKRLQARVEEQEVNVQALIMKFLDQKLRSTPATSEPPVPKQEASSSSQVPC